MSVPALPEELADHWMSDDELADLWHRLCVELLDLKYANRTHHNRRTYDAGCKGPLCGKATREHARRRTKTNANEKYEFVDKILDYWYPIAVKRIQDAQAIILEQLTAS